MKKYKHSRQLFYIGEYFVQFMFDTGDGIAELYSAGLRVG